MAMVTNADELEETSNTYFRSAADETVTSLYSTL